MQTRVALSVPATSHKRCGSTKYHIAYGTNGLRNIGVNSVSHIAIGANVLRNIVVNEMITTIDFS